MSSRRPPHPEIAALHAELVALRAAVVAEGAAMRAGWAADGDAPGFAERATNLSHYVALRRRDLRPLQRRLMTFGLSSLGRLESRVLLGLDAVVASLVAMSGKSVGPSSTDDAFFAGEALLASRTAEVLGPPSKRGCALLVTLSSEAADDPAIIRGLADAGVEALRIDCAHDDAEAWGRMIVHRRMAEAATGRRLIVLMDLAGPKIRTGDTRHPKHHKRLRPGTAFALVPPGGLSTLPHDAPAFAAECTLPEALGAVQPGDRIFMDDAKAAGVVVRREPWGVVVEMDAAHKPGVKLHSEKGLTFPDTELFVSPLTAKDLHDLTFVAAHADGIAYSFVQSADDVAQLQAALAERRPHDWQRLSLVLKIETQRGMRNLPAMVVQASSRQPTAIMIARGDQAAEIGFVRTAEMQEQILWLAEAARVPVIWATQVLESLVKNGVKVRGEMTDAAVGARAECVMLNKGPHVLQAVEQLDRLLSWMAEQHHKKTPQLRALKTW